jgi:hypothetical protein
MSTRADRHDRHAGMSANRSAGGDFDRPFSRTVPSEHHDLAPKRILIRGEHGKRGGPCTLHTRAAYRGWQPHRSRIIEGCIEPHAGDGRDAAPAQGVEGQQSGIATVADQHEVARGRAQAASAAPEGRVGVRRRAGVCADGPALGRHAVRNGSAQTRPAQGIGSRPVRSRSSMRAKSWMVWNRKRRASSRNQP